MKPLLPALLGLLLLPGLAHAAVLEDYLLAGYSVIEATTVTGFFHGCQQRETLNFDDGSRFLCSKHVAGAAVSPKAYFLAHGGDLPSVLMIGGQVLDGNITKLGDTVYPTPLQAASDPPVPPAGPDESNISTHLTSVSPVQALNDLEKEDRRPLNKVQDLLPSPPLPPPPLVPLPRVEPKR